MMRLKGNPAPFSFHHNVVEFHARWKNVLLISQTDGVDAFCNACITLHIYENPDLASPLVPVRLPSILLYRNTGAALRSRGYR